MEKVQNVSIDGVSFILEEAAHTILKQYLDTLEAHYKSNPNGSEIMESLEGRIAELLLDRGCKSGVVTSAVVQEVIDIIGKPEDIYCESNDNQYAGKGEKSESKPKKKLYRNPDDKILGGVFGGLGAYFDIDPILMRVGFMILFGLGCAFGDHFWGCWPAGYLVLAYFILLFCTPVATTTEQKCSMRGESLSYDNIEKQVLNKKEDKAGSDILPVILKIICLCMGGLLLFIGVVGLIGIVTAFCGIAIAGLAIPSGVLDFASQAAGLPYWTLRAGSILTALVAFLPFIGILYGGCALLFRFKSPKWMPGLVIFIIWLLSLFGLAAIGIAGSQPFWNKEKVERSETLTNVSDTLHIEFEGLDQWEDAQLLATGDTDSYRIVYVNHTDKKDFQVVAYPDISLHRRHLEDKASVCASAQRLGMKDINKLQPEFFRVSQDTLFIPPVIYGKGYDFDEVDREIDINIPDSVTVLINRPIEHEFNNSFNMADWRDIFRR